MKIILEPTKRSLSTFGGASVFEELLKTVSFDGLYSPILPVLKYKGSSDATLKLKAMICSFISGCDCFDDIERLSYDPVYAELFENKVYTPKTYGNFLRSFTAKNISDLQDATIAMNLKLRSQLEDKFVSEGKLKENIMNLDCDSTKNRQYRLQSDAFYWANAGRWL